VPETIARVLQEAAPYVPMALKPFPSFQYTFEPAWTPTILRRYESQPDWRCPPLTACYPRLSTDREAADQHQLEWVTPGHPLVEALRRHTLTLAQEAFGKGTCFYSLQHVIPARQDFYRTHVVDGLGQVIHERLFAVETTASSEARLQEPGVLGNFAPASVPEHLPGVVTGPEATEWLTQEALTP
jgi:hypothetical protein